VTRRGNECGRSERLHLRSTCRRGLTFVGPLVADMRRSPIKGRTLGSATVRPLQLPSLSRFAFAVLRTLGRNVEEIISCVEKLQSSNSRREKRGSGGLHMQPIAIATYTPIVTSVPDPVHFRLWHTGTPAVHGATSALATALSIARKVRDLA
jgi:hypothetical protein